MNSAFKRGNPDIPEDELKESLRHGQITLDIVRNMLYTIYVDSSITSKSDYVNPNWAYLKANQEGRLEVLEEVLRIISSAMNDRSYNPKRKALTDARTED